MVALQEQQKPRDAAVAVAKRMVAEKIQVEGPQNHKGRNPWFFDGVVVEHCQVLQADRRVYGRNRPEAGPRATVWELLDDVSIFLFVFTGIPDIPACQAMEFQNRLF